MSASTARSAQQAPTNDVLEFAQRQWRVRRPRPFVLVIEGEVGQEALEPSDYLHEQLLLPQWREAFYQLVDATGLVVCLNVHTQHPSYRDVRGRSSKGRLSQGEYYHHDGCSGPVKPRLVEIRCPIQPQTRGVATAVAPHRDVVQAMVQVLPAELTAGDELGILFSMEGPRDEDAAVWLYTDVGGFRDANAGLADPDEVPKVPYYAPDKAQDLVNLWFIAVNGDGGVSFGSHALRVNAAE